MILCTSVVQCWDPRFKLNWSDDEEKHKKIFLEEADKLDQAGESDSSSSDDEPSAPKKSKLFSYMAVSHHMCSKRKKSCEQEQELGELELRYFVHMCMHIWWAHLQSVELMSVLAYYGGGGVHVHPVHPPWIRHCTSSIHKPSFAKIV